MIVDLSWLIQTLGEMEINFKYIRVQGYDGASSVGSQFQGLCCCSP